MVDYHSVFHEDYTGIVQKVVKPKKLSIFRRIQKQFNFLMNKHIQVNDYEFCILCKLAYSNAGVEQEFINPYLQKKYRIAHFITEEDGLQFYMIKSNLTKDLIFAFRGTDEWKDWLTNLQIMQRKRQFETAKRFLDKLIAENIDYTIYFCGHSLGGALAQSMYVHYQTFTKIKLKDVVTFNSAGVRMKQDQAYTNFPIRNYIIEEDLVGNLTGYHYGKTIYLKAVSSKNYSMLKLYTHSLDQFTFNDQGMITNEITHKKSDKIS